jgi:hypothetical protein
MKATTVILVASTLAATAASAEDEHRQLGPHEHGHGQLNIAIEKTRVAIELEVPGMDIVGFEHAAGSADEKAAVDKATKVLGAPLEVFKLPTSAGCKVQEAKVAIEAEDDHDDGEEDHAEEERHEGGEHAKDEHDEHEGHEGHNEFHVTYALDCAKPAAITSIEFDYFKSFPGARNLTVNVVTAKAQNTYEVSREKPSLDLGGMM